MVVAGGGMAAVNKMPMVKSQWEATSLQHLLQHPLGYGASQLCWFLQRANTLESVFSQ